MKRDDDLIRQLLMEFEAASHWELEFVSTMGMPENDEKALYHVLLLEDQGLVVSKHEGVYRLTSQGHDFLQAIRNDGIWARTKAAVAEEGGNATLAILRDLATGFLKKQISDKTGVQL